MDDRQSTSLEKERVTESESFLVFGAQKNRIYAIIMVFSFLRFNSWNEKVSPVGYSCHQASSLRNCSEQTRRDIDIDG